MGATRIVILGGGFAGVYTARRLLAKSRSDEIEVHLINRENYLVFQPMLPEVISGSVGIADTVTPIRHLLPRAQVHIRDIESVNLEQKHIICAPGFRPRSLVIEYDHLVLAMGNVTDFRGMTGLGEHALPFKTHGDALALRNHMIRILEEAEIEIDPNIRKQLLTFVVAGGGFSGVEVMAELHDFVRRSLSSYPHVRRSDCRFVLLHSRDRILPEVHESLALYAQKILAGRGIELMLNTRLKAATGSAAILGDDTRIQTATLVATVPSHPNPVCDCIDLPKEKGRFVVNTAMQVKGTDCIWALGDCALVPIAATGKEKPDFAPPTAQHAIREAKVCAGNIIATVRSSPLHEFTFKGLGALAALGHRKGIAQVFGFKLSGLPAWFMWRTVYWSKLPGLDRKIRVGLSWALDLFFPPDIVQLRTGRTSGINHEHFEPGQVVFEQGDLGDRIYIIIKGSASVMRVEPDETEPKQIAMLTAGQYFGEMALLHRAPRNATIHCVEPMDVLSIEKSEFASLMAHLDELRTQFESTASNRQHLPTNETAVSSDSSESGLSS